MNSSTLNNQIVNRLLTSLGTYYNINSFDNEPYLVARCDYFEKSERFMVSKKANLWSANAEEFLFLFYVPQLTLPVFEECMKKVGEAWPQLAHIGPDHMYTYVTPVFVCDSYEDSAAKKLKKCRTYKSFLFSFHGWMEYHTALITEKEGNIEVISNFRGSCVKKMIKKVFGLK